ncbi:hypothetical protein Hanom_Chr16g01519761 [Helianthus anomalus]
MSDRSCKTSGGGSVVELGLFVKKKECDWIWSGTGRRRTVRVLVWRMMLFGFSGER